MNWIYFIYFWKMKKIALFDVCFTIYNCNTTAEFFKFIKNKYNIRYYLFIIFNKLCLLFKLYNFFDKRRFIFLKWLNKKDLEIYLKKYYKDVLINKINIKILEKIKYYKKKNFEIYLISASFDLIISKIASELNIKHFYWTELIMNKWIINWLILNDLLINGKKELILNNIKDINYDKSVAFSDSENDLYQWRSIKNRFLVINWKIKIYE